MAISKIEKGQPICRAGDALTELFVIGEGSVQATFPGGTLLLSQGDIIGISDIRSGVHSFTCIAASNVSLVTYPFSSLEALLTLMQGNTNVLHLFFTAGMRLSVSLMKHCEQIAAASDMPASEESFSESEDVEALTADTPADTEDEIPDDDAVAVADEDADTPFGDAALASQASDIPPELADALDVILSFGDCDEELAERFTKEINTYKAMPDKDSTQDEDRAFRNGLARDFYKVYAAVFEASLQASALPPAVKLFLNFGFVDAELAGAGNSTYLLSIADVYQGAPNYGIFTFYEWLTAIYERDREPSRNEFDLDYGAFLREQRVSGKISPKQEQALLGSNMGRIQFELENVFPLVNKMTFGRISTFCPVLSEHNLIKSLPECIVTPQKVQKALNLVRETDFSAYYRETIYSDDSIGIVREYIDIEVLPDVILMPNAGIRGAMWQEIEGKRRTTPARMMISAISLESISKLIIRMTGEFRWEMCKRIQGAYWNNISERSLTSEYTDYAQFYRKNHDLSPDAKEKIKLSLQKCKNSIKEMFVRDYICWIAYEGQGSPRLNKIARNILFTYCPFPSAVRDKLLQHPLYHDMIDRYRLRMNQKLHHLDMLCAKIEKTGNDIPKEIEQQKEFFKK